MASTAAHAPAAAPGRQRRTGPPERDRKRFGERRAGPLERWLQGAGWSAPAPVTHAVDGVDPEIRRGEVVGLVGESGCGKSTLGRMVAGLMPPSAGEIRYRGRP